MKGNQKGVAMILALFLVLALEALIIGGMLTGMQVQRTFQRDLDRTKMIWASEAITNRAIKLLEEYIKTENKFPNTDSDGFVVGNNSSVTDHTTFSNFVTDWYADFKSRNPDILQGVNAEDITIKQIETVSEGNRYDVTAHLISPSSKRETKILQRVLAKKGSGNSLFDYSVFYNDDLELTRMSHSLAINGSVHSNKNIYINPKSSSTSNYGISMLPRNGVPLMSSAGNIYYYSKRFVGTNYLLSIPAYKERIPSYYHTDDASIYNPASGIEIQPLMRSQGTAYLYAPKFYYAHTWGDISSAISYSPFPTYVGVQLGTSTLYLQPHYFNWFYNSSKYAIPFNYWVFLNTGPYGAYYNLDTNSNFNSPSLSQFVSTKYLSAADETQNMRDFGYSLTEGTVNILSTSTFYDFSYWPNLDDEPRPHPQGSHVDNLVEDKVPVKIIDLGMPLSSNINPSGMHALIEPLTDLFPENSLGTRAVTPDTPEIKKAKFQSKADLNLYFKFTGTLQSPGQITYSSDYERLFELGIVNKELFFSGAYQPIKFNIRRFIDKQNSGELSKSKKMIYIHVYPGQYVSIENGEELPQRGLTLATNGGMRLGSGSIGDYQFNTFIQFPSPDSCNPHNVYAGTCTVPPAALISDYFWLAGGPMSWKINASILTGHTPSRLIKRFNCNADMGNCTEEQVNSNGTLGEPFFSYSCSDKSYANGPATASQTCEFYLWNPNPAKPLVKYYYLNLRKFTQFASGCNPAVSDINNSSHCNHSTRPRYPIYADIWDNTAPVFPYYGVYFNMLSHPATTTQVQYNRASSYERLYEIHPNYGVEGIFNLDSLTTPGASLESSGTLAVLWPSRERDEVNFRGWSSSEIVVRWNPNLTSNPPPGFDGGGAKIKRERWKEVESG